MACALVVPARLRQLRMLVADVEPLGLLVLVRLYQLVRQVLVSHIFTHLNTSPSDYSWVIGTQLWLHQEELPE
jgi:hypothetical protein